MNPLPYECRIAIRQMQNGEIPLLLISAPRKSNRREKVLRKWLRQQGFYWNGDRWEKSDNLPKIR